MYIIYLVTNIINGKAYIGQTTKSVEDRWKQHLNNAKYGRLSYFYSAIRKYGPESFTIRQIDFTESHEEANELEKLYIEVFKTYNKEFGYNSTFGGEGGIPTKETRQKQSLVRIGKYPSWLEEANNKRKNIGPTSEQLISLELGWGYWKDKTHSEETKKKMSLAKLGKHQSKEHIEKRRHSQSEETRHKISVAMKEFRQKQKLGINQNG